MTIIKKRIVCLLFLLSGIVFTTNAEDKKYIRNPVLPGFHPDPCAIRVDNDYYIVNSTFEWFPGIPIYHSTDLINWRQVGNVLTRKSQLDLTGIDDADGIYAPSITYYKGLFYVTYTVVQNGLNWASKGYPNYIVTAKKAEGPWSEPVLINALGFDPYLFIDDDGKAYMVTRIFDHRTGKNSSPGIGLHELNLKTLKPVGQPEFIYSGWGKQSAEGPKILKKDGYYYLFTAEGGTGYGHYEAVARSKNIRGPYERAPNIFYTTKNDTSSIIQKAGHGTVFSTPENEWYTTHLGSRPLSPLGDCPLGRETFIQKIKWNENGWPELADGTTLPSIKVDAPKGNKPTLPNPVDQTDEFTVSDLDFKYCTLREPPTKDWLRLNRKKGCLSLRGREALGGSFRQSMVAQRITSFRQQFETRIEFTPTNFRHRAGLCCYYNTHYFYALGLTYDETKGIVLELTGADQSYREYLDERIPVNTNCIYMRMKIDWDNIQFYYSIDGKEWLTVGSTLDFRKISDDYAGGYTGAMAALFAQDMMYENIWADFDYFKVSDTTSSL